MARRMRYAINVTGSDTCRVCQDSGFVELVTIGDARYSRGSSPCKWCEEGKRRYTRLVALRWTPDMAYDLPDVVGFVSEDPRPASAEDARRAIAAMRDAVKPVPRGESRADVEGRKHAAHRALADIDEGEAK